VISVAQAVPKALHSEVAQPTGNVFNLQRYSLNDGPGIRTTVFLKGCPARCWWCHNPESQQGAAEVACFPARCISCDACLHACHEGLQPRDRCVVCGSCCEACPTGAREIVGESMTVAQVVAGVMRDRMFFEDSGGGVTFSGGEPLSQPVFLKALLKAFRDREVRTTVDTAGFCPPEALIEVAPLVDLFLFDLKCIDPVRHLEATGIDNRQVLENLERLSRVHHNIWIRVPVIPGFNDDEREMDAIAETAIRFGSVRELWLLPYHSSWTAKPGRFGKEGAAAPLAAPSAGQLEKLARICRAHGLVTHIGGEQ
jgi:pyruvate formate lyase activating enzyme